MLFQRNRSVHTTTHLHYPHLTIIFRANLSQATFDCEEEEDDEKDDDDDDDDLMHCAMEKSLRAAVSFSSESAFFLSSLYEVISMTSLP